ncbi:hypothetical protein J4429_04075 [Candidatus Pacearchaeota archaeon]|nr:hypothetical protein [Candidatus Pacearchaeota archaeon]
MKSLNNKIMKGEKRKSKSHELRTTNKTNLRSHNLLELNINKTNPFRKRLYQKNKIKNKSGQVTIFIILALIIVVVALIYFYFRKPLPNEIITEENPYGYIRACTLDALKNAVDILDKQGGDIYPKGSVMHQGRNITYLCYTANFYSACINQRPLLIEHIQKQLSDYLYLEVSECFDDLKSRLENKYTVEIGEMSSNLKLKSGEVDVEIKREFIITKDSKTQKYENFNIVLENQIYDLTKIAMEITNQEAQFCNFDILGFMITYPKYNLNKFRTGDSDIIYSIKDRRTNQEFKFAIRSCVLPAGF